MPRKEELLEALLLEAFKDAGSRGLTAAEMHSRVGDRWRPRLERLESYGCRFVRHRSRFVRSARRSEDRTFRWVLVGAPELFAGDVETDADIDQQLALLEPPPPPPSNAIAGEPPPHAAG